jgi:hypothetical protein
MNTFLFGCLLLLSVTAVLGQSEVRGISSFNLCFEVSPSSEATTDADPYLNCTDPNSPSLSLNITTIDLRLTASGTSNSTFRVNLTTVPNDRDKTNTNGVVCNADPENIEDCIVTTPAEISIESTKYIYYYDLTIDRRFVPQYCYTARFDTITSDATTVVPGDLDTREFINYGTAACMQTVNVDYCLQEDGECSEILDKMSHPVEIATNSFPPERAHQRALFKWQNVNIKDKPKTVENSHTSRGTCRDTMFSFDSVRKSDPIPVCDPKSRGPGVPLPDLPLPSRDDAPTISGWPISDPPPLPLESKINTNYGNVLQDVTCTGFNCGGIYDGICYSDFFDNTTFSEDSPPCAMRARLGANSTSGDLRVGPIGTNLRLYSLGPECTLYSIDEIPAVSVTVDFKVVIDSNGDGIIDDVDRNATDAVNENGIKTVQTFTVNNLNGLEDVSSPQGVGGARVVSVDTVGGSLGPAFAGYVIICSDPDLEELTEDASRVYRDPKKDLEARKKKEERAATPDPGDDSSRSSVHFVDMRSYIVDDPIEDADFTFNPWSVLMEEFEEKSEWYPTGEILNYSPIEGRRNQNAMWYTIPIEKDAWIGRGCNQLALTDLFWNTNFQGGSPNLNTGLEQCYLSPFTCVPGYTDASFGGRSIPGCLASAAFKALENGRSGPQWDANGDVLEYVIENGMPPFYDPENPNYWPLSLKTGGFALAFDPSKVSDVPLPTLSFRVLLDLVGSFVAYESTVPNGDIFDIQCDNETVGELNFGNVTVRNLGSKTGSYRASVSCPLDTIEVDDGELLFQDVPPGGNGTQQFSFSSSVRPQDFAELGDPCIIQLIPAEGSVFVILDSKSFTCSGEVRDVDPDPPVINIPPIPEDNSTCGCRDFACWDNTPGKSRWDSICYLLLVLPLIFFGAAIVLFAGYYYITKKRMEIRAQKREDQVHEQFVQDELRKRTEQHKQEYVKEVGKEVTARQEEMVKN